jgi:predicted esterase YcpF (UPF0227 family)
MILYIHGFGSSGQGAKSKTFREHFRSKKQKFIAPSLSFIPELAISTLEELIKLCEDEEIILMGSSLGGYYAIYLAEKYDLQAVLINPSIKPYETLQKVLGDNKSYFDENFSFSWKNAQVQSLKKYETNVTCNENFLLLVATGDEVLDYSTALKKCQGAKIIVHEGSDHGFLDVDKYTAEIDSFIKS